MADSSSVTGGVGSYFNTSTILSIFIVLVLIAFFIYFYRQTQDASNKIVELVKGYHNLDSRINQFSSGMDEVNKQLREMRKSGKGTQKILTRLTEQLQDLREESKGSRRQTRQNVRTTRFSTKDKNQDSGSDEESDDDNSDDSDDGERSFRERMVRRRKDDGR